MLKTLTLPAAPNVGMTPTSGAANDAKSSTGDLSDV